MGTDPIIANPWTPYGLSDDPYFQEPLAPAGDPRRPGSLFVGRQQDLRLLGGQVVGSSASRALVQGPAGIGKTTFINQLKDLLAARGVCSHAHPVHLVAGMSPRTFMAEVLRVVLQIHATVVMRGATGRDGDDAFWSRITRIVAGEDGRAGGITLGPVGIQSEPIRIAAEVTDGALVGDTIEALERLARLLQASDPAARVLLHVDNLENLELEGHGSAAALLQSVRDVFLARGAHWLLAGAGDVDQAVLGRSPQVAGIVPLVVTLGPLPGVEIVELLARRYRHLQRGRRLVPPIDTATAERLYALYDGDLRGFLRLLSRAVQHRALLDPGATLTVTDVVASMAPLYRAELERRIGFDDVTHLAAVFAGQAADALFRVTDVATRTGLSQPAATQFVKRLGVAALIVVARTQGRSTWYRLARGDTAIALGLAPMS